MISAIILARCTSSRLPNKHFYQIGNKKIIDIIIHNLKSNKIISQIYLATGTKTKNFNFLKIAKKNKINIYFHNNEDNVTERIYKVTKKIKTKYSILISGDCCLVDNSFIKRLYKSIKLQNKDFVKSNDKLIHEGITLFKTDIWSKVNKNSKKYHQKEHPGYVVKEYPNLFDIANYKPLKYETGKKFRLSVDTESDLDFFNNHYDYLNKKNKKFDLLNIIKSKNFNYLNEHVEQKKAVSVEDKKYIIITSYSKSYGIGHLSRAKTLLREINETITSKVEIICLGEKFYDKNFIYNNKIKFIKKINDKLLSSGNKIIIDLPKIKFQKLTNNQINKKNIVIIDNYRNLSKPKFIIPSARKLKLNKKNLYSGKDYLIVSRKVLKFKNPQKINKNLNFLLFSGSEQLSPKIMDLLKFKKDIKVLVGPLLNKKSIKVLKKMNIDFEINKKDYFHDLNKAKNIYCKFGVSAYEIMMLNKKPIIIEENETEETKKDIKYLFNMGLVKLIKKNKIKTKEKKINININKSLKNIIKLIKK